MARIYCAGPLFNDPEREEMQDIAARLEHAGHETFLPQRDGLELAELEPIIVQQAEPSTATAALHRAIFNFDAFKLLSWSDGVVANFNGRVPDEGTIVEAALAWHSGKALIIYKRDSRTAFAGHDNPMLTGLTDGKIVEDRSSIVKLLEEQLMMERHERLQRSLDSGVRIDSARTKSATTQALARSLLTIAAGKPV